MNIRRKLALGVVLAMTVVLPGQASALSPLPGEGWFHFDCSVVRDAPIDPLLFPGTFGVSHVHEFFGNRSISQNSTNQSLRWHPATSCRGDNEQLTPEANRVYSNALWYPRFYENGVPLTATKVASQYSVGYVRDFAAIQPFTANMNFIAGTASGGPQEVNGQRVYNLLCPTGQIVPGTAKVAPTCNTARLRVEIRGPDCWNGLHQSSANFKSHLAYSSQAQPGDPFRVCPSSHPVLVPSHRIAIELPTRGGSGLTVATGSGATASTQGDMSTIHYDYMSADVRGERTRRTKVCLNQNEYCGGTPQPVPGEGGGI